MQIILEGSEKAPNTTTWKKKHPLESGIRTTTQLCTFNKKIFGVKKILINNTNTNLHVYKLFI